MRLDHFIAKHCRLSERQSREEIVTGKVLVDGVATTDLRSPIDRFHSVSWSGRIIQEAVECLYLMLHKPVGIVSATIDSQHRTVVDLIDHPDKSTLHLAGRLDRSSSGLVLLSNDSRWTEAITAPTNKVPKVYCVETDRPIPENAVSQFREGFFFATEGITTRPAALEILDECSARVTLLEGRYHQIKRMFHRLDGIRLRSLHRERIGHLALDETLREGHWRKLNDEEVGGFL